MSRIEQAITAFHKNKFPDLRAYVLSLGQRIITDQECSGARIAVQGEVPFLQETPVSQNLSVDTITFTVSATFSGRHENPDQLLIGASLHHMTACPCTLSYNQILLKATAASQPLPTHSQRSITHLQVESAEPPYQSPTFGELVTILTSTVHSAQDLLKRPDEAELVLMAHHHPQFAEDVGREIARRVGESFGNRLPEKTRILIESRSLESIHIHDVVARLATTLGKILQTGTP
jgi:GTP cyclohydrolase FolE2